MKKSNLTRRQKRLLRERVIQHKREANRIARLGIVYNPNKLITRHAPSVNNKFRAVEPTQGKIILSTPRQMNFRENLEETLEFFGALKKEIIYGVHAEIMLEQKHIEKISPEAAIMLCAELQRCLKYKSAKKRIKGNYPVNPDAAKILTDIGFYSSLNIKLPTHAACKTSRSFFKVIPGNVTDARIANQLVQHFEKVITFDPIARKRLIGSLIECMDNVHSHAYRKNKNTPDLIGEWWMAGFIDKDVGQAAFIFFDQGVGVPTTLREKWVYRIRKLVDMNDGELIQHAVLQGITRRDSNRHGNGLPSFKEFINELPIEAGGFLRVISNKGDYSYCKHTTQEPAKISQPLDGTLIIWAIQTEKENTGEDGRIDLSSEGQQLRQAI